MVGSGFRALSDPTRRQILELLSDGTLTAGQIAEHFDLTKPTLSHHLEVLREAGLISSERSGRNITYELNTTVVQDLMSWLFSVTNRGGEEGT